MSGKANNSLATPGYFIKRLRDAGFIVIRLFQYYAPEDERKWTIMVNPGLESIMITCLNVVNEDFDSIKFAIHDGGVKFPPNFIMGTSSINVIIKTLIDKGVEFDNEKNKYFKTHPKALEGCTETSK